jgi:8-amino-7-oxononanoate synthase
MVFFPEALQQSLEEAIEKRRQIRRLWTLRPPEFYANGVNFISNDFLSLNSGVHREAVLEEIARYPDFKVGAAASRVADGSSEYTFELERWLADFHNAESCLLFNSGFDANVAIFSILPRPTDIIVHDSEIHASVHTGMRASRASLIKSFAHNDPQSLKKVLLEILENDSAVAKGEKTVFVAIESIYSMDGDIAPAAELVQVVKESLPLKNAVMVVDEAHSNGIMGPRGSGFICHHGLESEFAIRLHTFGKGINATGGKSAEILTKYNDIKTDLLYSRGPLSSIVQRDAGELRT